MKSKTIENQDVSAALKLLGDTVKEEKTRIFKKGADAMQNEDAKASQAILDFNNELNKLELRGFLWKPEKCGAASPYPSLRGA